MKEITKEIKKVVEYEAIDGTRFETEEACRYYERSARCELTSRYNKLIIGIGNENSLFCMGNMDNLVDIVFMKTDSDLFTVKAYADLVCGDSKCITEADVGHPIMLDWGYNHDWLWNMGSLEQHLKNLTENYNFAIEEYSTKEENQNG